MANLTISLAVAGEEIVTGALRRVGEVAINALGAAFKIVGDFAVESFKGALEAQAGIDRLTGSIVRLGEKSPISIEQAMDLSQQFKNLVGGSDDVVLAMQDVILRFDKISSDTFPRVIEQSADLAVALGTSPTQAATLLGKVLQDLGTDGVGSIGRLKAAGVALTEEQNKQILSLVEAGKVTEAQNVLLDALAATTGGKALTASQSLTGQWDIFKETIADAGEGVAMKLLPPLTELAEKVLPIIMPLIGQVADALGGFAETLASGNISGALAQIGVDFNTVKEQSQPLIDAVMNILAAFGESMPMIQGAVQVMADFISAKFAELSPVLIANVSSTLNSIAEFWRAHGDEIMAIVTIAFQFITVTVGVAMALLSATVASVLAIINGDWAGAGEIWKSTITAVMDSILSIVGTDLDSFIESWQGTFSLAQQIVSTVFDNIISGIHGKVAELAAAAMQAALAAIAAIQDAFGMHSPSTIGIGLGRNLMASMAQGILGGVGQPVGAMRYEAGAVANSVINSGGNTYNYYGVQADTQAAYTRSLAGAF